MRKARLLVISMLDVYGVMVIHQSLHTANNSMLEVQTASERSIFVR